MFRALKLCALNATPPGKKWARLEKTGRADLALRMSSALALQAESGRRSKSRVVRSGDRAAALCLATVGTAHTALGRATGRR